MNDKYYLKITELPVISLRIQTEFDNMILEYIEKFKEITSNLNIIIHLIATAIDYPYKYVEKLIEDYKRSNLLTEDLTRIKNDAYFMRSEESIKCYDSISFIYDKSDNSLTKIKEDKIKKLYEQKEEAVELDIKDYINVYQQIFYCDDFFNNETKLMDKHKMSFTLRKLKHNKKKDFLKEKIVFYPLTKVEITKNDYYTPLNECNYKLTKYKTNYEKDKKKYQFLLDINEKGYYEYNLAKYNQQNSNSCDETIKALLELAQESIFIMTTKIDTTSDKKTKAFNAFDKIRDENKTKYIRTLTGFDKDKDKDKIIHEIKVEPSKNYYSQRFNKKSHSKILIIDNFFVALGSGNWFSNSRDNYEDSLIIFPCINAIKNYCPIYFPSGDYYQLFNKLVNETNDLMELFKLYAIMQKDSEFNINNDPNCYDEILNTKIIKSIDENINNHFGIIQEFLKYNKEFKQHLTDSKYKDLFNDNLDEGDDNQ